MAPSGAAGWGAGDLCLCGSGGFDWELPGELLWASRYCCVSGEDRGSIRFDVLGWGDGGPVYRLMAADEGEDKHCLGERGAGGLRVGRDLDGDAWAHGDVGDSCGWAVQLGDVSEHLHGWIVGAGAPDEQGLKPDGGGDCGWGADSAGGGASGG